MATAGGPKIVTDGLVFGYDTNYGVADNVTGTRFYPGGSTVNHVTDASLLQDGWSGSYSLIDSATKSFQFNVGNFNGEAGSGQGWRSFMWDMRSHAGSAVTISATIEVPSDSPGDFAWVMMGQCNTRASGTTLATYLGYSATSERYQKTTKTKQRISWSGTIGNTGTANQPNGIIGFTVWYNGGTSGTNHFIKVSNVQIEKIAHETPFVNGTRSSTASLIDLKETTDINVSNLSFDSTGQPEFDGTNDVITTSFPATTISAVTIEAVVYRNQATTRYEAIVQNNTASDDALYVNPSGLLMFWPCGSSSLTVPTGQWSHVAVSYNGTTLTYIVNGTTQVVTATCSHITDWDFLRIGAHGTTDSERWIGKIAVAKVYEKSLSAAELTQNYNAYKNRFDI